VGLVLFFRGSGSGSALPKADIGAMKSLESVTLFFRRASSALENVALYLSARELSVAPGRMPYGPIVARAASYFSPDAFVAFNCFF
jgi:hypothetical protein